MSFNSRFLFWGGGRRLGFVATDFMLALSGLLLIGLACLFILIGLWLPQLIAYPTKLVLPPIHPDVATRMTTIPACTTAHQASVNVIQTAMTARCLFIARANARHDEQQTFT